MPFGRRPVEDIQNSDTKPKPEPIRTQLKAELYAAEIRCRLENKGRIGSAEDYLSAPLLDCDLGHAPSVPLLGWIHFDQLLPTQEALYFTGVPGTDEGLLLFQRRDSSDRCRYFVYGLIENDCTENVEAAVIALFKANGHSTLPLINRLPTSIFYRENWDCTDAAPTFGTASVKYIFRSVAPALWPANMERTCDLLRHYPDPWQRTLTGHTIRESGLDGAVQRSGPFNEAQFNQWFVLVTDQKHIEEERTIFRADWQKEQVRLQKEQRVITN
jgi:hypothetical protein